MHESPRMNVYNGHQARKRVKRDSCSRAVPQSHRDFFRGINQKAAVKAWRARATPSMSVSLLNLLLERGRDQQISLSLSLFLLHYFPLFFLWARDHYFQLGTFYTSVTRTFCSGAIFVFRCNFYERDVYILIDNVPEIWRKGWIDLSDWEICPEMSLKPKF